MSTGVTEPPVVTEEAGASSGRDDRVGRARRRGGRRGRRGLFDRIEAFISRLSTRNNFWHRVCSLIWLPYAFRSGIRMKRIDQKTFQAVLPYKKFNRNWYNAMAGAALVGNSEIAGGMYIFGVCGGAYTVVCKELRYRFLRPCFGPALYRVHPSEELGELIARGGEFNITLEMDVVQHLPRADSLPRVREKRVGHVTVTFHVTPKEHQKAKGRGLRASRDVVRSGERVRIEMPGEDGGNKADDAAGDPAGGPAGDETGS